jgi:hypothetical protein
MAAHLGVDTTFGVTKPSGSSVNKASRNTKIETFKTEGEDGEWLKYTAGRMKTVTVKLEGHGTAPLSAITAGDALTPATKKALTTTQGESNKQTPATMSIDHVGHEDFTDADAAEAAPSATPDLSTIEIVSVDYSLTENLTITTSVQDVMIADLDGKASTGFRATCGKESSFSMNGYGDLPVSLGTGGAGVARLTGGKLIVSDTGEIENAKTCNQWSGSGGHCPSAT